MEMSSELETLERRLREYIDLRVQAMREQMLSLRARSEAENKSAKEAVTTATEAMNRRLEGMNEFRSTLKDQAATFVTREVMEEKMEAKDKAIERQSEAIQNLARRISNYDGRMAALAAFFVLIQIAIAAWVAIRG